jgi:hypothetical protein
VDGWVGAFLWAYAMKSVSLSTLSVPLLNHFVIATYGGLLFSLDVPCRCRTSTPPPTHPSPLRIGPGAGAPPRAPPPGLCWSGPLPPNPQHHQQAAPGQDIPQDAVNRGGLLSGGRSHGGRSSAAGKACKAGGCRGGEGGAWRRCHAAACEAEQQHASAAQGRTGRARGQVGEEREAKCTTGKVICLKKIIYVHRILCDSHLRAELVEKLSM